MPAREHRSLHAVIDIRRVGDRVVGWSRSVAMLAPLLENKLIATLFSRSPGLRDGSLQRRTQCPGSFAEQRKDIYGWTAHRLEYCRYTPHCLPFLHARRVAHSDCGLGLRAVDRGLYVCQSCAEPLFEPGGRVDACSCSCSCS